MNDKIKSLTSELEAMETKRDQVKNAVESGSKELKTLEKQIKLQKELIEDLTQDKNNRAFN